MDTETSHQLTYYIEVHASREKIPHSCWAGDEVGDEAGDEAGDKAGDEAGDEAGDIASVHG